MINEQKGKHKEEMVLQKPRDEVRKQHMVVVD